MASYNDFRHKIELVDLVYDINSVKLNNTKQLSVTLFR